VLPCSIHWYGKRIAWEVVRENSPSPLEYLLGKIWRRPVYRAQIEVWTSGIDGSRMEMVGYLPHDEDWSEGYDTMGLHLAWLPSSKALRFAFKEKIYTVKTD
jgi:hypothetical protein